MNVASPDTPLADARMTASPLATAVARPVAEMSATDDGMTDHVTSTPVMGLPDWSRTSAENCTVCPTDATVWMVGVTRTSVGVGGDDPSLQAVAVTRVRRAIPMDLCMKFSSGRVCPGSGEPVLG